MDYQQPPLRKERPPWVKSIRDTAEAISAGFGRTTDGYRITLNENVRYNITIDFALHGDEMEIFIMLPEDGGFSKQSNKFRSLGQAPHQEAETKFDNEDLFIWAQAKDAPNPALNFEDCIRDGKAFDSSGEGNWVLVVFKNPNTRGTVSLKITKV